MICRKHKTQHCQMMMKTCKNCTYLENTNFSWKKDTSRQLVQEKLQLQYFLFCNSVYCLLLLYCTPHRTRNNIACLLQGGSLPNVLSCIISTDLPNCCKRTIGRGDSRSGNNIGLEWHLQYTPCVIFYIEYHKRR